MGAAGAENFHSPPHNGGENDNFCNQSWGGEYQVLKSATKMGGERLILPLTMGGPLSMVFGCYQNRKKPLLGGDRPPIMGGRTDFPPKVVHFSPYSAPPHDFFLVAFSPPEPMFWGGENASMGRDNESCRSFHSLCIHRPENIQVIWFSNFPAQ